MTRVTIAPSCQYLTLDLPEGPRRFHAIWLRDNAQDDATRSPHNGQRLIAIRDVPADTAIVTASISEDRLTVSFRPGDVTTSFDLGWLARHAYDRPQQRQRGTLPAGTEAWTAAALAVAPTAQFGDLAGGGAPLCTWLGDLTRYGFAKIVGGPVEPGALFRVVGLFGYVRETNYGRHFEVRTEVNPTNLAYTSLGLQAHTDNPYRDPVPTVQVLYCLESSAEGGENMVVDGFAAARRLQQENPALFDVLADHCALFSYAGDAATHLSARRPLIELAPDGTLVGVRFNNRSLDAVTDIPFEKMDLWYAAYRRFGEIIDDPAMEISFRLNPGEAFVVDNTRVLHARKGYSGAGTRWLQGCYADMDGVRSTHRALLATNHREAAQ